MKEITISWVSSFCMIMLPSILFGNSIDTINPIIISKADFGQIDIIPHSVYWVDKTNELPIESLDFSKFKQVDGDKIKARPRETYYIGFEIENELADSNEVNIYIRNPIYSEFFKLQKGKLFPLGKLGRAVLNSDKIKFQLEPKSKTKYLVSYVAWADHSNIRLEARSSDSQRNYLQNIKTSKRVKKAFERFFWIVLFVMGILAFTFYYFIEIEAFKWYGFYLFSTLFMFSKGFPEIFMGNSYLYKLFYLFEPLFSLGMTLFYILFAQSFLNLRKITPTVNKVVTLISFF